MMPILRVLLDLVVALRLKAYQYMDEDSSITQR